MVDEMRDVAEAGGVHRVNVFVAVEVQVKEVSPALGV